MRQTTVFARLRPALLLRTLAPALLLWAMPAQAADEDTQLWFYINGSVPLGEDARATLELSPRFREGGDQLLTRATVELAAADWATVGVGGAYVEFAGGSELRTFQQVTLNAGAVAFRTRVEERYFDGEPRAQLRLRQRVGTSLPLSDRTALVGSAELLYIARTENPLDEARVDSWRALAGIQHKVSDRLTVGLNYLAILSPREGAPDRLSHVPQVQLVFRP